MVGGLTGSQTDSLNTPIVDLVLSSDVSVRLQNVITAASRDGRIPAITIADYLTLGDEAPQAFLKLQNCGRKSFKELDRLIKSFIEENRKDIEQSRVAVPTPTLVGPDTIKQAETLLNGVILPDEILKEDISVRLYNVLNRGELSVYNLLEYIRNQKSVISAFQHGWGAGRKTIKEFEKTCDRLVRQQLQTAGIAVENFEQVLEIMSSDHAERAVAQPGIPNIWPRTDKKQLVLDPIDALSFEELIALALNTLDEKPRDVVTRRYGLNRPSQTLEEVGNDYGVTRERIRQIQAKAVKRMRKMKPGKKLTDALDRDANTVWSLLADGKLAVKEYKLSGSLKLAFDISATNPDSWLKHHAVTWRNGWYRGAETPEQLESVLRESLMAIDSRPLPIPTQEIEQLELTGLLSVISTLSNEFRIYLGYVFRGYVGVRAKRTVRLHRLLCQLQKSAPLWEIINSYRKQFPDDQCTPRDAEICMEAAPHLFIQIFDDVWSSIGNVSVSDTAKYDTTTSAASDVLLEEESEPTAAPEFAEGAIAEIITQVLSEFGPLPFTELRDYVNGRMLDERSRNSVGPVLLTSGCFRRLLPGVYSLPEQVDAHHAFGLDQPQYVLNDKQCRWYVMSRWAGEDASLYPLWEPLTEYAWCRWAQQHADAELFHSLLAVCTPANWQTSEAERAHWSALKAKDGLYCLQSDIKHPLEKLAPTPDRVLAATIAAIEAGHLSWISANRVLKKRVDAHMSAGLLAALVALRVLKPTTNWQLRHELCVEAAEVRISLESELFEHGELIPSSTKFSSIIRMAQQNAKMMDQGWVATKPMAKLLENMSIGAMEIDEGESEADELQALDSILKEKRTAEARARHESLIDQLIG